MNITFKHHKPDVLKLVGDCLPLVQFHEWDAIPSQFAGYLRQLLQNKQSENLSWLELPSVLELAERFKCCELDIFDALHELKQQAYCYEMQGIDGCIKLCDPLLRKSHKTGLWAIFFKTPRAKRNASYEPVHVAVMGKGALRERSRIAC